MSEEFHPCELMEHGPHSFSLTFTALEEYSDYIQDHGGMGSGYSWEALVSAVLEMRGLDLAEVEFDSESDMFAAVSPNRLSLRFVAAIIRELTVNRALMSQAVARAQQGHYFE